MNIKDKIEKARERLHLAINFRMDKERIIKISRQLDEYIVDYYKEKCKQK